MIESDIKAKLSFSDGTPDIDLPIYKGTVGPDVIDIRKLYGQTGKFLRFRLSIYCVMQ
jgi:citrate synthase